MTGGVQSYLRVTCASLGGHADETRDPLGLFPDTTPAMRRRAHALAAAHAAVYGHKVRIDTELCMHVETVEPPDRPGLDRIDIVDGLGSHIETRFVEP
jgi:hypothetical protein